jgi:hypothetical protein
MRLAGVTKATDKMRSSFSHHVVRIIFGRAKKQMGSVYAATNITAMKDEQTIWNRSICLLPREAMREKPFTASAATIDPVSVVGVPTFP